MQSNRSRNISIAPSCDTNVVLSYGDLSHTSGYQTRVLGELEFLDSQAGHNNTLMVFDRHPETFVKTFSSPVPFRVHARSAMLRFYPEMAGISRRMRVRTVHAHNLYSAALALSARRLYRYKVILDYHGRIPEEYVYLGKGGEPSRKVLESLERWAVKNSDHVVAVSEKLREYVLERYRIPESKVSVIPCCADARTFNRDIEERNRQRQRLGLSEKFICTHLGSFFEWYKPELLLQLFDQTRAQIPNAHLLVVSGTTADVQDYLQQRLPPETFTVVSAKHEEVPGLLNAADIGFLLLRASANIKTSSPAKFSEYLNCGLPVLITPDVGDFSDLVAQQSIGQVVQHEFRIDSSLLKKVEFSREEIAANCVRSARHLTWQYHASVWNNLQATL